MLYTLTLFIALFLATLTLMVGAGLLGSLLSLRMSVEGFAEPVIGVIMAGFYVGLVAGSFICPGIVRRAGHIRAFAVFAAINTATALLYPLLISPWFWLFGRVLSGLSMMGLYMVIESWLNDRTEAHMRGRVFSVYMAMTFFGLSLGQLLLQVGDVSGSQLFLIVGIFVVLSLVPVALTRSISPTLPEVVSMRMVDLFRKAPMGLLGSLVVGMIAGAFYSLGPVFAAAIGLEVETLAYYMGLTIICGFLMQWPVGTLSDRLDRQKVLAAIALLVSIFCSLIVLCLDHSVGLLFLATGLYGGFAFTLYPVAVAHANDRIAAHEIVPASTLLILVYGLGACIGPVAAAVLMAALGPMGLYLFIGLVSLALGLAVTVHRRLAPPREEEPVPFVPGARTSPVISSLHPYSEEKPADDESAVPERVAPGRRRNGTWR